jgi:hypothetical protein
MSNRYGGRSDRVHQRRMYGVLALLASILTLAAIWNMPSDPGEMQSSPAH